VFCPNCGNKYGCSCSGGSSKTIASDGKEVCSKCITQYETYIALLNESKKSK
jgi:hypothetical protein